jgi:FixJ family two-component response regulator
MTALEALREGRLGFRELTTMEVREVLRRLSSGQALREIARETGLDRKTVRRYAEAALVSGFSVADGVLTDTFVAEVARRVQDRPLPPPSDERSLLGQHRERIAA